MSRSRPLYLQLLLVAALAPAAFAAGIKVHVRDTTVARTPAMAGAAAFLAQLDQPVPAGAVMTLEWQTVDGTAVAKTDYTPNKGTVTITPADKMMKVIAVVPLLTGKEIASNCAFSIKVKASITGSNTVSVDNPEGKATATILKGMSTPVAHRAN